jgi:hypothetical protein
MTEGAVSQDIAGAECERNSYAGGMHRVGPLRRLYVALRGSAVTAARYWRGVLAGASERS